MSSRYHEEIYHKFEYQPASGAFRRVWIVEDDDHQTVGSYGYDTEEATRAAEDEEIANLESGKWTVVGIRVFEPCDHPKPHCADCSGWVEMDEVWGCVVESNMAKLEEEIKRGDWV